MNLKTIKITGLVTVLTLSVYITACGISEKNAATSDSANKKNSEATQTKQTKTFEAASYSVSEINGMFISNLPENSVNDINEDNLDAFNSLLGYTDSVVGKDNYYIGSLYEVDYEALSTNNAANGTDTYIIKIIPKEYEDNYNSWAGNYLQNPYTILFSKKAKREEYDNYYQTFLLSLEYEKDLKNEFSKINPEYEYVVDYNTFLYISAGNMRIDADSTWSDALSGFRSSSNKPTLLVIVPNGTTEREAEQFAEDNKEIFEKYYIQGISICVLNPAEHIENYDDISKYSSEFETYYYYSFLD